MRWLLMVGILALVTGCGSGDDEGPGDAGEFSKGNIETMIRGQWARSYEDLHPEHQAIVPRDLYVDCNSQNTFPAYEVEVDDVYDETIDVPRLGEIETKAITMKMTVGDSSEFLTRHLVEHDGEWKWIANEESLTAYEAGECP